MIKCEKGVFEAQGSDTTLKAELAIIIENLKKCFAEKIGQKEADEEIREAIRIGFMTEEELRDEFKRVESKISEKFSGAIEDIMELIDEAMCEAHGGRRK